MNLISGQEPGGFAIHKINALSPRVRHGVVVRSRSESNLRQTSVLQAVSPYVRQPVYFSGEQHRVPWFGPHDATPIPGHLTQINRLMAGHVDSVKMEIWRAHSLTTGEQVVAA